MKEQPVDPNMHGLIDYGFAAVQLLVPSVLNLNKAAKVTYAVAGLPFLVVNALTSHRYAVKPLVSYKTHKRTDAAFLVGLGLQTFTKSIRTDKRTLAFHVSFTALAALNFFLTNYKAGY